MAGKTPIDKLSEAISGILSEYEEDIQSNLGEVTAAIGKKGVQALKTSARKAVNGTGMYARGWKAQVNKTRTGTSAIIYNEHPGLPHLLEHGHVTRNGTSRNMPPTPAHEHIAPVAEELVKTFESKVVSKL